MLFGVVVSLEVLEHSLVNISKRVNFLLKRGQSKSVKIFGSCLAGWYIEDFFHPFLR